jgi:hypothetical protein
MAVNKSVGVMRAAKKRTQQATRERMEARESANSSTKE